MPDEQQPAPVMTEGFPRRIGILANDFGFVEIRTEYSGAMLAVALPIAEARELAQHLVACADVAEKKTADAQAAKAAIALAAQRPRKRGKK